MLSNLEFKLLTILFAFVISLSLVKTYDFIVFEYERRSESARLEKERIEAGRPKIQFSGCGPCVTHVVETILPFQTVLLLFGLGIFSMRRALSAAVSLIPLLVILYGYYDWMLLTQKFALDPDYLESIRTVGFSGHLLINSNVFDLITLMSLFSLITLILAVTVRSGFERIGAETERTK